MKKTSWLPLLLIFSLLSCQSNNKSESDNENDDPNTVSTAKVKTTLEEYNYVTKGYQIQLESGLDMKKGYLLEDVDTAQTEIRKATLKKLVKLTGTERKTTAYMLIYQKEDESAQYICIPHPNSDKEILQQYWKALYDDYGDASAKLQLITFLLSKILVWEK